MPYRRTENVTRRLTARRQAIVAAARAAAAEGGMAAVQIAPVAARAAVAAGTVYRYFPSKTELVAELVAVVSAEEMEAVRRAGEAAPGPLSAVVAGMATFAGRSVRDRRLAWAVLAEPLDPPGDAARLAYRAALATEFGTRIRAAIAAGHLPEQDAALAAHAVIGALVEGLLGPLAPPLPDDAMRQRAAVQAVTLLGLRALGVNDARARGLVVQTVMPGAAERAG
jgi:AcrR family transcriptional regulator